MLDFNSRKGFTLIEILMVIFIIGILSALAVNGYTEYRRTTLLGLGAENLIGEINEMRDRTIYGDFGGERFSEIEASLKGEIELSQPEKIDAKCYGIHFKDDGAFAFSQPFENQKVWKGEILGWGFAGCGDFFDLDEEKIDLGEVKIERIAWVSGGIEIPAEDFALRFAPPKGVFEVSSETLGIEKLRIYINYKGTTENRYKRVIEFVDFNSLKADINEVD